jgi:hypothetical protein
MRFFASWWERFPGREIAPTVLTALVVAGAMSRAVPLVKAILGPYGFSWG